MRYVKSIAFLLSLLLTAQLCLTARESPQRLSDIAFWEMINSFSEDGGDWDSFYMSNEFGYPSGVLQLVSNKIRGGAYLGVGPEQNFTYIAAVRPDIAFVIDIRRENMLEHLMYKAVFELSPTRSSFVSRLFSRSEVPVRPEAKPEDLLRNLDNIHGGFAAKTSQEIRDQLTKVHGYSLSAADLDSIDRMRTWLAGSLLTYSQLMAATDENGRQWSYLASEENYKVVRELQLRNLIVPVTGDFAGTKALKSIADYLNSANTKTSVFYISNVEQSLRGEAWRQFYRNVGLLRSDAQSVIVRAISDGRRFVPRACSMQEMVKSFKDTTRQGFDPTCSAN